MTPTTKLINVDAERTVYLDQFKDLIKWTYKKTYKGLEKWWVLTNLF
jgi:hypothetical protein